MKPVDKLTIKVLIDNLADPAGRRPEGIDSEFAVLLENGLQVWDSAEMCSAHHGLSLLVTAEVEGQQHTVMFDGGPEAYAIERNGEKLGVEFGEIDAVVLSHGHCDHSEGLSKAIELIRKDNGNQPVPFYAHPVAFVERGIMHSGEVFPLQAVPSIEEYESVGAKVITSSEAEEILDGTFYLSGEIPRNSFERGLRGHFQRQADGSWAEDALVIDERFMAVNVRDKGLVVFTGCSHAGVINVLNHAKDCFPDLPLYAVVGGLHLIAPNEDLIQPTIQAMKDLGLQKIFAGHCTGWRGVFALVNEFGEEVVAPLAVGTRYNV